MTGQLEDSKGKEFVPGIILPPLVHGLLRKHLSEISVSDCVQDCLLAQARAEGLIQSLGAFETVSPSTIKRLFVLIQQAAQARLADLGQ